MPDVVAAIDETAANVIVPSTVAAIPPVTRTGTGSLGPFSVGWSATASLSAAGIDLIPPPGDVIRIANGRINYSLNLSLSIDLSFLDFCLPQVCVTIPFIGRVCTPRICISFPTITVPVSHSSFVDFSVDLRLATALAGGIWNIDAIVVGVPSLVLGPAATALLVVIGAAVSGALLLVPFIGPLLALASAIIFGGLIVANVLNLLGPILTPFVSGLRVNIYQQPQLFQIIAAAGSDPAVLVRLDSIVPTIDGSGGEDELVLTVEMSP